MPVLAMVSATWDRDLRWGSATGKAKTTTSGPTAIQIQPRALICPPSVAAQPSPSVGVGVYLTTI